MRRVPSFLLAAAALAACAVPPAAVAAPACPGAYPKHQYVVLKGQGVLESAIVDRTGRLYYTDTSKDALMRLDRPGAAPVKVAGNIANAGGLAWDNDESALFVGQGDGVATGILAPLMPGASLLRVDVATGAATVYAKGLAMANGLARAADGTIYASDDVSIGIDRIAPGGATVTNRWANVLSGNGMAIDPTGRYLYVNQTFVPAAIQRVDLQNPASIQTYAKPPLTDIAAGLDGMTIDAAGRLYVAANGAGQVWRVGLDRRPCVLLTGLLFPSAVALGRGSTGFADGHVYAVTFSGDVVDIPLP